MNYRLLISVLLLLGSTPLGAADPRHLLQELEAHPFNQDVYSRAVKQLKDQHGSPMRAGDPWFYLAVARANLISGYRSGSRFLGDSFRPSSIDKAKSLVARALDLDPELSRAYAMRARIHILEQEYDQAWKTLNKAHMQAPESFHPWYLLGVLNRFYKEYDKSLKYLGHADSLAEHDYQKRWVIQARRRVFELTGNVDGEEQTHRKALKLFPGRAHSYGNYGGFLLEQERYAEAVKKLETAVSIQSYPIAEKQLQKARRKANGRSR